MCLLTQFRKAHAKPHSQRPQSNMSYKAGQVMKIMISMRREGIPRPLRGATAVIFFIGGVFFIKGQDYFIQFAFGVDFHV